MWLLHAAFSRNDSIKWDKPTAPHMPHMFSFGTSCVAEDEALGFQWIVFV